MNFMAVLYITHPEVVVEPHTPPPRWGLSDIGIARMRRFAASATVENIVEIWSSTETKAVEAAGLLASRFGLPVQTHLGLCENDRTSTGFRPPPEFNALADAFFAAPTESVQGWETAIAAQSRVVDAWGQILRSRPQTGDIAIVAHGDVGALLLCELLEEPISRARDQPFQGHYWTYDTETGRVLHDWKPIS